MHVTFTSAPTGVFVAGSVMSDQAEKETRGWNSVRSIKSRRISRGSLPELLVPWGDDLTGMCGVDKAQSFWPRTTEIRTNYCQVGEGFPTSR
jgi:hypothetical protein